MANIDEREGCVDWAVQLVREAADALSRPVDAEAVRIILLLLSFAEDACSGYISGSGSDLKWQRERDQACTDASALLRAVGEEK